MTTAYSSPIVVRRDDTVSVLKQIKLSGAASVDEYDEAWLQNLLFAHPEIVPAAAIDSAFGELVPICMEVSTAAGFIDVLYATPSGRLVVLEAKLWRNPEARRKVIGQILDYAKELSRLTYESLDAKVREARRRSSRGTAIGGLADVVQARYPGLSESSFIDAVSRSLQRGDFLLLIAGDGIREGVGAITDFLEGFGTLHFTFGLIEMAIYAMPDGAKLVQPRVLAQSTIIKRIVVTVEGPGAVVADDSALPDNAEEPVVGAELLETRRQFTAFWDQFLARFRPLLQDQNQLLPNGSRSPNLYFYLPKAARGWISAYVAQSVNCIGVYLTFERGPVGDRIFAALEAEKTAIEKELGIPVTWMTQDNGKHDVSCRKEFDGVILKEHSSEAYEWFTDRLNRFITTFRPRVEQLVREQDGGR